MRFEINFRDGTLLKLATGNFSDNMLRMHTFIQFSTQNSKDT